MKVDLVSGKKAKVEVRYTDSTREVFRKSKRVEVPVHVTKIRITVLNEDETPFAELEGRSDCVPEDPYNKTEGKKVAIRELFDQDPERSLLTSEDRKTIMKKVCPCFFSSAV